jgi:hypothetical protein
MGGVMRAADPDRKVAALIARRAADGVTRAPDRC